MVYLKSFKFRLGIGSNYFKQRTFSNTDVLPAVIKGQINYLGFDFSLPFRTFNIGLENQISKSMIISTASFKKKYFNGKDNLNLGSTGSRSKCSRSYF